MVVLFCWKISKTLFHFGQCYSLISARSTKGEGVRTQAKKHCFYCLDEWRVRGQIEWSRVRLINEWPFIRIKSLTEPYTEDFNYKHEAVLLFLLHNIIYIYMRVDNINKNGYENLCTVKNLRYPLWKWIDVKHTECTVFIYSTSVGWKEKYREKY